MGGGPAGERGHAETAMAPPSPRGDILSLQPVHRSRWTACRRGSAAPPTMVLEENVRVSGVSPAAQRGGKAVWRAAAGCSGATITDRQKLSAMYLAARIQPERCIGCPAERSPPRTQPVRSISGLEAAFSAASAALGSRRRSRLAAALAVLQLCGGWECGLRHVRTC